MENKKKTLEMHSMAVHIYLREHRSVLLDGIDSLHFVDIRYCRSY